MGLKLVLPAKVKFRIVQLLQEADVAGALPVVEAILGTEQMESVYELDVEMSKLAEVTAKLTDKILEAYGVTTGE